MTQPTPKKEFGDKKKDLWDLEEVTDDGEGGTVRLYPTDWYLVTWLIRAMEDTDEKQTAAELIKNMIRSQLKEKYDLYSDKIEEQRSAERTLARIKRKSAPQPPGESTPGQKQNRPKK